MQGACARANPVIKLGILYVESCIKANLDKMEEPSYTKKQNRLSTLSLRVLRNIGSLYRKANSRKKRKDD